ncbi:hypothetical protein [Levilactobacillus zymae]|uniref:hypothetical protein n=1 Tax=Levilactobacillus zymae TaxID=267363 RepID=UPI0028B9F9C8|nr:hypothetical protein [Levilactobacillus zymae]MDT6981284.1 hypothetical protein [Levilactobacillus zymae]
MKSVKTQSLPTVVQSYLKVLPLVGVLLLLNCQFVVGHFVWHWSPLSWYWLLCYGLFPLADRYVHQLTTRLLARHPVATPTAPRPRAAIYAAGLPLMPLEDYDPHQVRFLPALGRLSLILLLAPAIVLIGSVSHRHNSL